jgi:hypothetical protein
MHHGKAFSDLYSQKYGKADLRSLNLGRLFQAYPPFYSGCLDDGVKGSWESWNCPHHNCMYRDNTYEPKIRLYNNSLK